MKTAIIVGCNGQDGRLLYNLLLEESYAIIGIAKDIIRTNINSPISVIDITQEDQVAELIKETKPDEVYYLVAFHHAAEEVPSEIGLLFHNSHQAHVASFMNFLEAIRKFSVSTRIFYAASSHIFGRPDQSPQDENTPILPLDIYGITKATGFHLSQYYRIKHSLFISVGILYNHESKYRRSKFVSRKIIKSALKIKNKMQKQLVIGDLEAEVDWGYAPDYVKAMHSILNIPKSDNYIIATGQKHTISEFIKIVFNALNLDWKHYVFQDPKIVTKNRIVLVGNPQKLKKNTGWEPTVNFNQMVITLLKEELINAKK